MSNLLICDIDGVLDIIKASVFDGVKTLENEIEIRKIAELEAKVFVYESFIKSAGFKLPKETRQKE